MSSRVLSYSEVSRALDCWAQWDFSYGSTLAGSSLQPRRIAPMLSGGRAWGAAVAAYHANADNLEAGTEALEALDESLELDAAEQRKQGVFQHDAHVALRMHLLAMLNHYVATCDPFVIENERERELLVPIPSRNRDRGSSRYKFVGRVDGFRETESGPWIVEFKLRQSLTSVELLQLNRQVRWYAWAWWKATGQKPVGVEVVERLAEAPKQPRLVQGRKKGEGLVPSHAKDQLCTVTAYVGLCEEHNVEPVQETVEALKSRRWQQRVPIMFREDELDEAGQELVAAAKLIRDLDSGELHPLRNAKRGNCGHCQFREICPAPDPQLVDSLFRRLPPKRERGHTRKEGSAV